MYSIYVNLRSFKEDNLQTVRMQQVVIVREHLLAVLAIVVAIINVIQFGISKVDLSIWHIQSETCCCD